jgi:acyl carrier protein
MDLDTIKQQISDYIRELSYGDLRNLTYETLIFRDGIFDSMGLVSLITFMEEKYSIQITENDLDETNFESINAISSFILKKI